MENVNLWAIIIFILGYLAIIFEPKVRVNKAASALATGVLAWFLIFIFGSYPSHEVAVRLLEYLGDVSQLLFFLMGAMLIVETIDVHKGFELVGELMPKRSSQALFLAVMLASFLLSSVLDNLTTMIVFVCLLRRMVLNKEERAALLAPVVVAVNAGGAWTPIGDVTTTMLWIENKISSLAIMQSLFIPAIFFTGVFCALYYRTIPKRLEINHGKENFVVPEGGKRVLFIGLLSLLLVPVWKAVFGIPPFMGILFGVTALWFFTDFIHHPYTDRHHLKVYHVLGRIDTSTIFFFLGILLAVDALQMLGILSALSEGIFNLVGTVHSMAFFLGILSSIVDNVPLVAACIKMFSAETYPMNHPLWNYVAFSAGVGGSLLLIGSAPGVALMSMEGMDFWWYFRRVSFACFISYVLTFYLII